MGRGKSFLVMFVLAAAIGAYAYFVESKREPSDPSGSALPKATKVWTIERDTIEELEVKATSGEVTKLRKAGAEWRIVEPRDAAADQDAVGTILTAVTGLESSRTVDENPPDVKPFELDPARVAVTVKTAGDATPKTIALGGKTPSGSDLYARVQGEPKVFLVGSYLEDQLNRTLFDLRDKTVLKFDRAAVDALSVQAPGTPSISVAKKGEEQWRLSAPVDAEADFSVVDGILNQLSQARMQSIVEGEDAADTRTLGLDRPQATVTVGAGSTRATLAIGGKTPDGALYARDLARPDIFTVEATLLDNVRKKPEDIRQKTVFEFRSYTGLNVEITRGQQTTAFTKEVAPTPTDQSSVPAPDTWKQTKPSAKDVDQTKVTDFLVDLANLKAESFTDRPIASGDEYVVTVRFGDRSAPKEERATFRKSGNTVHVVQQGEPGAGVIPAADFDKVLTGLNGLQTAAPPLPATPPDAPKK